VDAEAEPGIGAVRKYASGADVIEVLRKVMDGSGERVGKGGGGKGG
jgi:hypothetical protein